MANISQNEKLKTQYLALNRNLTMGLLVLVILSSAFFWSLGIDVQGMSSVLTGLVLIILAVIFYKLPYISFVLLKRQYRSQAPLPTQLEDGWPTFKNWIETSI